jgi:hypothetical protein
VLAYKRKPCAPVDSFSPKRGARALPTPHVCVMQHFNVTQSWPSRGRAAWPVVLLHFRHSGNSSGISCIPAIHGRAGKCSCISGIPAIHGRKK